MNTVPTWWKQESFLKFKRQYALNKDRALFFLGSGISLQAGLPNWQGLLEQVIMRVPDYSDNPEAQAEFKEQLKKKREHPALGSRLRKMFLDSGKRDDWRRLLNDIIDDPVITAKSSPIHDAIVALDWHSIVTTNYDRLIELAYHRTGRGTLMVSRPKLGNEVNLETERERFIYKIHGDIHDPDSTIVLTTEDYDKVYDESEDNQTQATLRGVLRTASPILFAGYSHDDETMRRFYRKAMKHTPQGNAFALVPIEEPIKDVKSKIADLTAELKINFIAYSTQDGHRELIEFFKYLADPDTYDAQYNALINAKRPTIIMLYCGGTIGSAEARSDVISDEGPLRVSVIPSRFDPQLSQFSEKLLEWYQDSYNLGSSVAIDVKWEVLPEQYQLFSENATTELWDAVLKKVDSVVFKYFEAPKILGSNTYLDFVNGPHSPEYQKLLDLFGEEREQYQMVFQEEEHEGKDLSQTQFISDFQSRYILGIVLLFGTDTMSYLVSALSFGFQHMPCSMVITGSNQPPDQSIMARSQYFNRSDAWKNILSAFYFLQSFGHTLTDSFICFGDTIHHGVNVRKIASEMGPVSTSLSSNVEPFVFRNLHIHGQYMFRLIDGVFCNNYYSGERIPYSSLVGTQGENFPDLRHIRRDPLQRRQDNSKILMRSNFCENSALWHVVASPSPPPCDVAGVCAPESSSPLRAIILEGFASGTYPTTPANNLANLLYDLYRHAIPIFLISQYGIPDKQQRYDVIPIRGTNVPVTPLPGLTIESALPILALVLYEIFEGEHKDEFKDEWGALPSGDADAPPQDETLFSLMNRRTNLIARRLGVFFRGRPNILTLEIMPDNIIKQQKLIQEKEAETRRVLSNARRQERIKLRGPIMLEKFSDLTKELKRKKYVFLYNHDFSVIVNEVVRRDELKGAGPDGFAALSDLGFDYGLSLVSAVIKSLRETDAAAGAGPAPPARTTAKKRRKGETLSRRSHPSQEDLFDEKRLQGGFGFDKLFQREPKEQDELLGAARMIIERVTNLLRSTNVANVRESDVKFPTPSASTRLKGMSERGFSFTITSMRFEEPEYTDEKYTAVSFTDGDAKFFEKLASGCESEADLEKYYEDVERSYDGLLRNKWRHRTSSLDWLLIGIFKGVTCGVAQFLRFDDLAVEASRSTNQGYKFVFRRAAHCCVLAGDDQVFRIRLNYFESNPPDVMSET